jgi:pimeloyl-ACP methyl ester carboxylesterase
MCFALSASLFAQSRDGPTIPDKVARLDTKVSLHYVEQGAGPNVVLIHGSLSDYTYWQGQMAALAQHYHVIAYSRRYNPPNSNPPIAGYSAITDADDLLELVRALHLGKVYAIGHSYGALTLLLAEIRDPSAFNAVILAEPPAMSLLKQVAGPRGQEARELYGDVQTRMVIPMKRAFERGDAEHGVGIFIDYVFRDAHAWANMSPVARAETMKGVQEWNVMLPAGTLFPEIAAEQISAITVPTLIMSGGQSYPFLNITDEELARRIPRAQRIVFSDAGHQMWLQHPDEARAFAEAFFASHGASAAGGRDCESGQESRENHRTFSN